MYDNLEKLREEVKRWEKRIAYDKGRLKAAEDKLLRAENSCIIANVKAVNLTPEQLAEVLKQIAGGQTVKALPEEEDSDYEEAYAEKEDDTEDFEDEEN